MKLEKKHLFFVLILVVIISSVWIIQFPKKIMPEKIIVLFKDKQENPIANAICKADIIIKDNTIEDKELEDIENIFEIAPTIKNTPDKSGKGYYSLETGIGKYNGEFEIKIVCVSQGNSDVGYTIINNTNIPCEIKNNGNLLIC